MKIGPRYNYDDTLLVADRRAKYRRDRKRRPRQPSVYVIRDAVGDVIYVGMSEQIGERLKAHRRAHYWPVDEHGEKLDSSQCVTVLSATTRADGLWIEGALISHWRPPTNRDLPAISSVTPIYQRR